MEVTYRSFQEERNILDSRVYRLLGNSRKLYFRWECTRRPSNPIPLSWSLQKKKKGNGRSIVDEKIHKYVYQRIYMYIYIYTYIITNGQCKIKSICTRINKYINYSYTKYRSLKCGGNITEKIINNNCEKVDTSIIRVQSWWRKMWKCSSVRDVQGVPYK